MYKPANPAPTMTASKSATCPGTAVVGDGSRSAIVLVLLRRRLGRDKRSQRSECVQCNVEERAGEIWGAYTHRWRKIITIPGRPGAVGDCHPVLLPSPHHAPPVP